MELCINEQLKTNLTPAKLVDVDAHLCNETSTQCKTMVSATCNHNITMSTVKQHAAQRD